MRKYADGHRQKRSSNTSETRPTRMTNFTVSHIIFHVCHGSRSAFNLHYLSAELFIVVRTRLSTLLPIDCMLSLLMSLICMQIQICIDAWLNVRLFGGKIRVGKTFVSHNIRVTITITVNICIFGCVSRVFSIIQRRMWCAFSHTAFPLLISQPPLTSSSRVSQFQTFVCVCGVGYTLRSNYFYEPIK